MKELTLRELNRLEDKPMFSVRDPISALTHFIGFIAAITIDTQQVETSTQLGDGDDAGGGTCGDLLPHDVEDGVIHRLGREATQEEAVGGGVGIDFEGVRQRGGPPQPKLR